MHELLFVDKLQENVINRSTPQKWAVRKAEAKATFPQNPRSKITASFSYFLASHQIPIKIIFSIKINMLPSIDCIGINCSQRNKRAHSSNCQK